MFCITCNVPFSYRTGKEERGGIHNPHFFQLPDEIRASIVAQRAAAETGGRGGGAGGEELACEMLPSVRLQACPPLQSTAFGVVSRRCKRRAGLIRAQCSIGALRSALSSALFCSRSTGSKRRAIVVPHRAAADFSSSAARSFGSAAYYARLHQC